MNQQKILELEKQINILEKEFEILERACAEKDEKKFQSSKEKMLDAQKTIKRLIK